MDLKGALLARLGLAGEALYLFVAVTTAIAGSGLLLTVVCWLINRACGARPPIWRVPESPATTE